MENFPAHIATLLWQNRTMMARRREGRSTTLVRALDDGGGPWTVETLSHLCTTQGITGHLAVLGQPYLDRILSGVKTVESRMSLNRTLPYGAVTAGDLIFLKERAGPLVGIAEVKHVENHGPLGSQDLQALLELWRDGLALESDWVEAKRAARYLSLFVLSQVTNVQPAHVEKRDRRPWVVLGRDLRRLTEEHQLCLDGHDFRTPRRGATAAHACTRCAAALPRDRLHRRELSDADFTLEQLRLDRFRAEWWAAPLDDQALARLTRRPASSIEPTILRRLYSSVGRVMKAGPQAGRPFRDGYQTPYSGDILYYAQHATASCCRRCIAYWHGVPEGADLPDADITYLASLMLRYIDERRNQLANHH